ncbi:MAG: RNA polymerase sigma factor [Nitrosomonas sp.]|nr:RNA polymerase sigma factor [Nitrosomonas sp.]
MLRATIADDTKAFGELVTLHQSAVRGFLMRLCHDATLADDLAQETFLSAYRKLAGFRQTGAFSSWLFGIAYRSFLQHRRQEKREREVQEEFRQLQIADTEFYEQLTPVQRELERAIGQLEAREAAAISLNISIGFSHSEVATIMNLPLGTVKSLINRGLSKLRTALELPNASERKK